MNYRDLISLPNLMSLSRVVLAGVIMFLLAGDTSEATILAGIFIIVAGITDGLDGYLARRLNKVSALGIALDPICDKLFALIIVIGLILYRDFPVWLAMGILLRDLLIIVGGMYLKRGRELTLPSNLTGKWAFMAIAVLLGAYVIRFDYSIMMTTPVVVILLIASLINYGRLFFTLQRGGSPRPFVDNRGWRIFRYGLLVIASVAHIVTFYLEFLK